MSGFAVYDADKVTVNVCGIPIDSGLADGEFVRIAQNEDAFTTYVGTDGFVTRSKTNNRTAVVTLSLAQTSAGNTALATLYNLDINAPNGAGVGTFICRDRNGTAVFKASKAWIQKPPDVAFAREATVREWTIALADLERFDGGN